ncbi:LamG-like jellyroll fold domain-containing protein [Methylosinus sp. R-45379]|uniref:LamG-like jellyroll fold domain-containing protein n=1 Tax=Methylosinus sp. R-45379 TaxID=980563 RepID=UPI001AEC8D48|nr:LamG-like jellyroll fold domain-containing protein [Methylosinus sp. R-45379]
MGGAGGGAFQLVAQGQIRVGNSDAFAAVGGAGATGGVGQNPDPNYGPTSSGSGGGDDSDAHHGGNGGSGGAGGPGGDGGDGAGGSGGAIKLYASDLTSGGATLKTSVTTSGGVGGGSAPKGGEGRFILGSNTSLTFSSGGAVSGNGGQSAFAATDPNVEHFTGPRQSNSYIAGAPQTPTIVGLAGGADIYGVVSGLDAASIDFNTTTPQLDHAPADALLAVMLLDKGVGALNQDYTGYDLLIVANVSTINVANPTLSIDGATAQALKTNGVGADQALTSLAPGQVWATLVPEGSAHNHTFTASIGVNASGATTLTGNTLSLGGNVQYLSIARPSAPTVAQLTGFDAIAADPGANHIFGVSTATSSLVVVNADDGSQRQLFKEAQNNVSGLSSVSNVLVTGTDGFVITESATTGRLATFKLASATGDLSFAKSQSDGGSYYDSMRYDAATRVLTTTGSAGLRSYSLNTTTGALTLISTESGASSAATETIAQNGFTYSVNASTGSLTAANATTGASQTLAGATNGLVGASDVAVSPDGGFVYVTSQSGNALSVFEVTSSTTQPLVFVETLRNGADGVRGLDAPTDVAVTADGQYVLVTARGANDISVFQRDQQTGALGFVQVVRDAVGGVRGLLTPTSLILGPQNGSTLTAYVGSLGSTTQQGGLATFNVDLSPKAPPIAFTTEHTDIESIGVTTGVGDDTVSLVSAPPAIVGATKVNTGEGSDHVVVADYRGATSVDLGAGADSLDLRVVNAKTAADTLAIHGGADADAIDVQNTGAGATTTINGDAGSDVITIEKVAAAAHTTVSGDADPDIVRVSLPNLPSDAVTTLHGDAPGALPGDTLIVDPQDPNASILVGGVAGLPIPQTNGSISLAGKGAVAYDTFEGLTVLSSPIVSFSAPSYSTSEGSGVTLTANVQALGSTNSLSGPVAFDIDGDGQFGEVIGTALGGGVYRVTLPWDRLVDLGLADNGLYTIAVRATNSDGLSTTAVSKIQIADTPPAVAVSGAHSATVGAPFTIGFTATDPSPIDRVLEWRVDWGDGSAVETFGADATQASHVYAAPGNVAIRATAVDKDTTPTGATSAAYAVTVGVTANNIDTGGPYRIAEGQSLTLTAQATGAPLSYGWDINNDGTIDKSGATASFSWSELTALGVNDSGVYSNPHVIVGYATIGSATPTTISKAVGVTVDNAPPSFATFVNSGPVSEGAASATVTFSGVTDPSPVDAASLTYRYDFDNNGTFDLVQGAGPATVPGQYLRQSGALLVHGQIVDKDGGVADAYTTITINEVAPTLTVAGAATADEGAVYSLSLSATDPGADKIKWWDVNWGDGAQDHILIDAAAANGNVVATHSYADNGAYTIKTGATDNDGAYVAADKNVTVLNVAPTLQNVAVAPAAGPGSAEIAENAFARLSGRIVDPGTLDSFRLNVAWGDGQSEIVDLAAGALNFDVAHRYVQDGVYTITTNIVDKDQGASAPTVVSLKVDNVAPVVGVLTVVPSASQEGSSVTVSGVYTDAGPLDLHTVAIDWGDGSSSASAGAGATIIVDAVNRAFTATHVYLDNPAAGANYTISAIVTDDAGAPSNVSTAAVIVTNAAPIIADLTLNGVAAQKQTIGGALASSLTIDENGTVTLLGRFADAGVLDTHSGAVVWGDGGASALTIDEASHTFTATHRYLDDNPTGTAADDYRIDLTLSDKDGASATISAAVTVANVAPVFTTFTNNAAEVGNVLPGEPVVLTGVFADPGTQDSYTLIVDWGDGTAAETLAYAAGTRDFQLTHNYRDPGFWTISAHLSDDDLGVATATTEARLTGVALLDGVLRIAGTPQDDTVIVRKPLEPVAYWNFNETSGTAVADSAGTPQNGTLYTDRAPDRADPGPSAAFAPFGAANSIEFHDDKKEYVAVADDAVFNLASGAVQLWFDASDQDHGWGDTQVLFSKSKSGLGAGQLTIGVDHGTLFAELEGVDATGRLSVYRVEGCDDVTCGDWHNVAFTFGEAGMKLYLDGALVGENSYTGGLQGNHEAIVIGASNADNRNTSGNLSKLTISDPFSGHIDEVSVYGRQLSDQQVMDAMQKGARGANDPNGATIEVYASFLPIIGQNVIKTFAAADVKSILIATGGGNDIVTVDASVDAPLTVKAGDGNDTVRAGSGPSALLGGLGDDTLIGGVASDVILGGDGADYIVGGGGDDLIDGGEGIDTVSMPIVQPTAYWSFDKVTNGVVADSVGTPQNGTFYGASLHGSDDAGAGASFHGDARQYVAVADDAALHSADGTIAFQFEADGAHGDQVLFAKNGYGNNEGDLTIGVADGRVYARLETGTTSYTVTSCDDIGCGWRQLAFSFGADGMKLYIDGALVDANSYSGGLANNRQAIVIGASDETNKNQTGDLSKLTISKAFRGSIDEVAVFGQALNGDQIRRLVVSGPRLASAGSGLSGALSDYQLSFVGGALQVADTRPALPQGVAYWSLDEARGSTTLADSAGAPQNATFVTKLASDLGNAGPSASVAPFGAGTSAAFHKDPRGYIAVANSDDFALDNGAIQLWFDASGTSGTQTLFSKNDVRAEDGLTISLVGQRLEARLDGHVVETLNIVSAGSWNQIAFTFGQSGMKLYLNGVLVGEDSYTGGLAGNHEAIVIGGSNASNSDASGDLAKQRATNAFGGLIDEVAIFSGSVDQAFVRRLMKEGAQKLIAEGAAGPTIDGTDQLEGVERLVFGDGTSAYVLGGANPATLSAADVQSLAGNGQLVVLGDGGQPLHLSGAWGDIGQRTIGNVLYDVYHNSSAQLLVQSGVQVTVDQQLLTPIAYWTFDGAGSTVADSAGAAHNGVFYANGQPDRDDAGPSTTIAPFGAGMSADFHDSSREYVAVANDPAFAVANGAITFWFDARSTFGQQTLFAKDGAGLGGGLTIGLDGNHLVVQMEGPSGVYSIRSSTTVAAGAWRNLAFTFGAGGMKLYLDGALVGSNAYAGGLTTNESAIVIGGSDEANVGAASDLSKLKITKSFDGHIDEVAFFGQALTANQIQQAAVAGAFGVASVDVPITFVPPPPPAPAPHCSDLDDWLWFEAEHKRNHADHDGHALAGDGWRFDW